MVNHVFSHSNIFSLSKTYMPKHAGSEVPRTETAWVVLNIIYSRVDKQKRMNLEDG